MNYTIAIKAEPSTPSGLSASRPYSLAVAVNIMLNDSPPENQCPADSDSGGEINASVEPSFNQSEATDSNPTGSVSFLHRQFSAALWLSWPSVTWCRLAVGAVV